MIDKRHFIDLEGTPAASAGEQRPRYPTYVEELMARVAETERRFEEKKQQIDDEILRTRERLEAEALRSRLIVKQELVLPFLEVLDNMERALAAAREGNDPDSLAEGVEMIASQFRAVLEAQGIEPIPVLRAGFDPNVGEAVGVIPVTDPGLDGLVLEEVTRGYRLGDQLVRPARVRVGQLQEYDRQ
ncbi:MAG: nucleotide exchange factor GrpE [Acidobacteriota bacterium]